MRSLIALILFTGLVLSAALAQEEDEDQETARLGVQVMESDQHGRYLADADGHTLYTFVNVEMGDMGDDGDEPMMQGVRERAGQCDAECLATWPAAEAGRVEAAEDVRAELLYTEVINEQFPARVVYNGWPLYYFGNDDAPGDINGHGVESFGGVWLLVAPDGTPLNLNGTGSN